MSHLCHVVFLLLLLPGGARRSTRVDLAHDVAQQQNNTLADGHGVSGESGEAWFGFGRHRGLTHGRRGGHVQQDLGSVPGGSSPLAKLATAAIDLNNCRSQRGRLTMMSGTLTAEGSMNEEEIEAKRKAAIDEENKRKIEENMKRLKMEQALKGVAFNDREKLKNLMEGLDESILAGITSPMDFFDPLGFTTDISAGKLLFYREAELKHGRVGMLASVGILVGEQFHPMWGGNIDVPSYIAFQQTPLQTFWPCVAVAMAIPELFSLATFQSPFNGEGWAIKQNHRPGNIIQFDPLGLSPKDPEGLRDMRNKELNNGRLAMIAAAGMLAQELATGQKLFR